MEIVTITAFQKKFLKAKKYYQDGRYHEAIRACNFALVHTKNNKERALVLNKRGYARRFSGFKSEVSKHREESYEMARKDWEEVRAVHFSLNQLVIAK